MAIVMRERESAGLPVPPPGQRFSAQYIGFARDGVRYIEKPVCVEQRL
jgi:hypothetical protein